jgi:hypothetical protein
VAISGFDDDSFRETLRKNFTPAQAVTDPRMLRGRDAKLTQIDRAFNSPGKQVFIYGDRGVGKTSLSLTAATMHQSADNSPIYIACDQNASFFQIIRDIIKDCIPTRKLTQKYKTTQKISIHAPIILGYDAEHSIDHGTVPDFTSINDAISALKYVCQFHSEKPVIIIDEFDQLVTPDDKKYFADLIKQVADREIAARFIFCGIGHSLEALMGAHLSTGRYVTPIELEPLSFLACREMIDHASEDFGLEIAEETNRRIAEISDGFPYYVHLLGEMIFWSIYDDQRRLSKCEKYHFEQGVRDCLREAQPFLKLAYEKSTQKYSDDHEEVLWAVADSDQLRRQISEIYEGSYQPIMKVRVHREMLSRKRFHSRIYNLCDERHGRMLVRKGAGWYQFRENIMRGFVRLKAEESNVSLGYGFHDR